MHDFWQVADEGMSAEDATEKAAKAADAYTKRMSSSAQPAEQPPAHKPETVQTTIQTRAGPLPPKAPEARNEGEKT